MKYRKWHGYAHKPDQDIPAGGLATFCPACPQPGINLPDNYKEDPDQWKFTRGVVMDGNFSAEHMKMKKPADDVPLSDGQAFFVEDKAYKAHLKSAKDYQEVSPFAEKQVS